MPPPIKVKKVSGTGLRKQEGSWLKRPSPSAVVVRTEFMSGGHGGIQVGRERGLPCAVAALPFAVSHATGAELRSRVDKPDAVPCHAFNGGRGRGLHADAANMSDLAQFVENWAGRPVVDKSGLMGLFNIQTTGWRPEETVPIQARSDGQPASAEQQAFADPSTPTLFDIFGLLGLKLEAQKMPVDTLTLVSIQPPVEN